jgi:hypothetical protein
VEIMFQRIGFVTLVVVFLFGFGCRPAWADRLMLQSDAAKQGGIVTSVMKPFEVYLVAQRDSSKTQLSAVVFTLDVPDGVVLVGEELLVDSLLGIGSTRAGINLVFRCVEGPVARVLRFRMVATRPLKNAVLRLGPDARTKDLAVVACKDENFTLISCAPESLTVTAH